MANTQFGQNFEAIFRENGGLSGHGTTPFEFVMPKSSFPQKFGQGFALEETIQSPDSWIVSPSASKGWHPNKYYEEVAEKEEDEILHQSY